MSDTTDDGARAVVAGIMVDPKDDSKCGKECPFTAGEECLFCSAVEKQTVYLDPGDDYYPNNETFLRGTACLAAEVKVDKDAEGIAREKVNSFENDHQMFIAFGNPPWEHLSVYNDYLALVAKLGG